MNIKNKTTGTLLAGYLKGKFSALGILEDNFDFYFDKMKIANGKNNLQSGGLHIATINYTMFYVIERISTQKIGLLAAIIQAWLTENNDAVGTLTEPEFDFAPNDESNDLTDVDISIEFCDNLFVVEDEKGAIDFDGKRFGFGDYNLDVAMEFSLNE